MQLLDREQVAAMLGIHVNTLAKYELDPAFPPAIRLPGGRLKRWRLRDIEVWLTSLEEKPRTA